MGDIDADTISDKDANNKPHSLGVGNVYTYDVRQRHFGESYKSLREMCKRYSTVGNMSRIGIAAGSNVLQYLTYDPSNLGGLMGYLADSYRLFRGPMNFKAQVRTDYEHNISGLITTIPQYAYSASLPQTMNCLGFDNNRYLCPVAPSAVHFSKTQVAEFQIPFQSIYHSLIMIRQDENIQGYYANATWQLNLVADAIGTTAVPTANFALNIYGAFGDETRFGVWVCCPLIYQRTAQTKYPNSN